MFRDTMAFPNHFIIYQSDLMIVEGREKYRKIEKVASAKVPTPHRLRN